MVVYYGLLQHRFPREEGTLRTLKRVDTSLPSLGKRRCVTLMVSRCSTEEITAGIYVFIIVDDSP